MQFINKTHPENATKGHEITRNFVNAQWQEDSGSYVNLNYKSFCKQEMVQLTYLEQNGYCCYCMRYMDELPNSGRTLEHVIPRSFTQIEQFQPYFNSGLVSNNIGLFNPENKFEILRMPPFPHIVAYENLVLSCNGLFNNKRSESCNCVRDVNEIRPLFFDSNISNKISYHRDGLINCSDESYEDTIETVNLQSASLMRFRKAWYEISIHSSIHEVFEAISNLDKRNEILDCLNLSDLDKRTLETNVYWTVFYKYRWFFEYYS